ncbi:hypothetical protein [Telmatospirillum siberiense]|nr:hypothetical protein [Telmatospirillum siberiense]
MSGWSCREAIAMERRHILEGEIKISRQKMIVSELILKKHDRLVPMAMDVLYMLCDSLEMSRTRLLDLESHVGEPSYRN